MSLCYLSRALLHGFSYSKPLFFFPLPFAPFLL
uniref:Uncharacterized protein n=1 Tax=Arundo donax TaxID=35708 RepID=A0A0A9GEH8_ARUDO